MVMILVVLSVSPLSASWSALGVGAGVRVGGRCKSPVMLLPVVVEWSVRGDHVGGVVGLAVVGLLVSLGVGAAVRVGGRVIADDAVAGGGRERRLSVIKLVVLSVSPLSASWSALVVGAAVRVGGREIADDAVAGGGRGVIGGDVLVVLSVSPLSASWSASASVLVFESMVT